MKFGIGSIHQMLQGGFNVGSHQSNITSV